MRTVYITLDIIEPIVSITDTAWNLISKLTA